MKQTLIWFNLQRDGARNGLSNINKTFAESLQLQMSVSTPTYEHFPVFNAGLSQVHMIDGWAKCKEKVPDVSDPNQDVETRSQASTGEYISY